MPCGLRTTCDSLGHPRVPAGFQSCGAGTDSRTQVRYVNAGDRLGGQICLH